MCIQKKQSASARENNCRNLLAVLVCVDTCSDAQMWPDSQSAGVSAGLDCTLSFCLFSPCAVEMAKIFHALVPTLPLKMSFYPNSSIDFFFFTASSDFWHSLSLRGVYSGTETSTCRVRAAQFRGRSEALVIERASLHLHLNRNSSPRHPTPHSLADV